MENKIKTIKLIKEKIQSNISYIKNCDDWDTYSQILNYVRYCKLQMQGYVQALRDYDLISSKEYEWINNFIQVEYAYDNFDDVKCKGVATNE